MLWLSYVQSPGLVHPQGWMSIMCTMDNGTIRPPWFHGLPPAFGFFNASGPFFIVDWHANKLTFLGVDLAFV